MKAATTFDAAPLGWVKREIDLALERADQALPDGAAAAGDPAGFERCRAQLHAVHGALAVVGLDGAARFTAALEGLVDAAAAPPPDAALARRGLDALRAYLDELLAGQPDRPLKLLPLYREILAAGGQDKVSASDLFFPDPGLGPPPRALPPPAPGDGRTRQRERARFQRGLLAWLRAPEAPGGVADMLAAVRRIEAMEEAAAPQALWAVAAAFLTALGEGALPADPGVKALCGQLDLQLRRRLDGAEKVAERLLRDALYFVAVAESDSEAVRQVKQAYRLEQLLPPADASPPQDARRCRLRGLVAASAGAWHAYCAGAPQALPAFHEQAQALARAADRLAPTDFKRLSRAIAQAAHWLAEEAARHSESLAQEIATALLLAQRAQETPPRLGVDFAHQVDAMVARLHGCIAGNPPRPGEKVLFLDKMARQAKEKLRLGQTVRELQAQFARIEQGLDAFFRDAGKRSGLAALDAPLRQAADALTALRQDAAAAALGEAAADLRRFGAADLPPDEGAGERLAERLAALGFFIDALPDGADDFAAFARALSPGAADAAVAAVPAPAAAPDAPAAPDIPAAFDAPAVPPSGAAPTLFQIFLDEARGHLATLRRELGALESAAGAPTPDALTRAAHTLAGIAGTVGLAPINRLGLAFERALLRRDGAAPPAGSEAPALLGQAVAALETLLATVVAGRPPEALPALEGALDRLYALAAPPPASPARRTDAPHLQDELDAQLLPVFLEEAQDLARDIGGQLSAWRADPADPRIGRALARLLHTLKGSARMAGAMKLGEIAHAIETRVDAAHPCGEVAPELIDEVEAEFDAVVQIVDRLRLGEAPDAPPAEAPADPAAGGERWRQAERRRGEAGAGETAAPRPMLRLRADLVDRLVNEAGELAIARARIEAEMAGLKESLLELGENVTRLRRQLHEIDLAAEAQMPSRGAQPDIAPDGFDPLEFDRYSRAQEVTRMMAESVNDVATVHQSLARNLDAANAALLAQARLNRELQQALMSVRMEPFASISERLHRVVRQTAKELGRRANLEIDGGQVELDRSVLEKMTAPLEHLLRNAVAHGLEDRATRIDRGKAEIGEIALTLAREGNEIILCLADDGAGLDFERIRARGVEAGLLDRDAAADPAQLAELIFTPGFSTASALSQVAGRGVGMDVVRTEVAALGGRIEVSSNAGGGTLFRLYIPLTLAVTQALLVGVGGRRYAVPSAMIEQVMDLREAELAALRDAGRAEWMGKSYPFHFLPHLLGEPEARPEPRRRAWVLLLKSGQQRVAVQVDALKGRQEVVVKNIGPQLARVIGIDGATVLGDGQVVLILNPVALATRPAPALFPALSAPPSPPAATGTAGAPPTVMVVDDSLTVRKITGRLLAREGYRVLAAKDGVDALEQMSEAVPDLLLVDIEMPRMDGFDLTRQVRADPRLKDVPIIMITSRTADKHRRHAVELGVNRYLGKPYPEEELLQALGDALKPR